MIDGVVAEDGLGPLDKVAQEGCARPLGEGGVVGLVGDVVGRGAGRAEEVAGGWGGAGDEGKVAVAHPGVEDNGEFGAKGLVEGGHEGTCLGGGNVAGGEVLHESVLKGDEVAAEGDFVGAQVNSLICGLEGGTAGECGVGVVAEEREVADVAAWGHVVGDRVEYASNAGLGDGVHGGS